MASSANQQQPFPTVPPSMSAGENHEMRDYYPPQDAPRPTINQTPNFKPYLGLRARLSQIWINRWTILLLLVLVRLLFAIASTDSSLTSARREALSACTQVENIGSSMASMPHYMSQGMNEMTASGIEKAVGGLMSMLEMGVTGIEEIVLFVIHMMTSTYLCLITLAVSGSLHAAVELGNEISKTLNSTIDEVTDDMGNAVKSVTDGINSILDKINFNIGGITKPSINLDDQIAKLKALEIPPEMQQDLQKLNSSIPTFADVQNFTDNIIRTPFEEVKKLIQGMDNFTFDRQLLPVPQKETLNFCSEGNSINDFFDDLIEMAYNAKKIALGVLIVLAIIVCVPMAWMETRRYRKMQARAALFKEGHEGMDVVYLASRPTSSGIGLWFGKRFGSARRQAVMRWAWAYATSVPMLFLLSLGIAGLFACFCQYLLLKAIEDKTPELTDQVADFAEKVVDSLNNASMSWSGGVNSAVGKLDATINDDMLGWVNTSTTAVNDTLNAFVSEMSQTLNDTFGGTVLYDPIKEVLNCLIGLKIEGFQKGLTWVQDNAHVQFPGVANNTFSLGALAEKSDSDSAAALLADPNGKAKDEITEAVDHVIDLLMKGIQQEALISTALVLIWLFTAIGGLVYASTHLFRRDDSETGRNPYVIDPAIDNGPKPSHDYPTAAPPQYVANDYNVNKAAPYTLAPRPFSTFEHDVEPQTEKVGTVGASHAVTESSRPGHLRSSSYGQLADPSPLDERPNPFSDPQYPREKQQNPFI
ncbi:plasma membrane fusion protein prm1 [Neocucurbitaria cava]|uniref:Plasma membrane fusion protein PRM1 n=1 Tax=Neocucurbitaria cava TaxID=798079 RepID=A0A9W9CLK4_9PLEO|nr:plasma membrane fusion protein prm1 [Neocucurbitaria cava]